MPLTPQILIIDDETDICFLLSAILTNSGYVTQYAHSLKDGMEKINTHHPDIILLDVNLPDGSGLDYVPFIKQNHHKTKLVVMSAHVSESEVNEVIRRGADSFLSKPISKKELMAVIAA
ncbi:MAG: response regulator [Bacteroidota bacterium]